MPERFLWWTDRWMDICIWTTLLCGLSNIKCSIIGFLLILNEIVTFYVCILREAFQKKTVALVTAAAGGVNTEQLLGGLITDSLSEFAWNRELSLYAI